MKWFMSIGSIPLLGFIWGVYEIRKKGKKVCNMCGMNRQEWIGYVLNMILMVVALFSTLGGLYKNYKFSNYCLEEGTYTKGEIVYSTALSRYTQAVGYYYDIKIILNGKEEKVRSYAESYYHLHETIGVYYVVNESKIVTDVMIEGNKECMEGNDALARSTIFWLIGCMLWLKRHDLFDRK